MFSQHEALYCNTNVMTTIRSSMSRMMESHTNIGVRAVPFYPLQYYSTVWFNREEMRLKY